MAASEEALLTGSVRLGAYTEARLEGNAYVMTGQPDLLVDMNGEYVLDRNGDRILLGVWNNGQLQGFLEIDLAIVEAALPRLGARQQIADIEVWIETSTIHRAMFSCGLTSCRTFRWSVSSGHRPGSRSRFPIARETRYRSRPRRAHSRRFRTRWEIRLASDASRFYAAYLTDSGRVQIPLMRGYPQEAQLVLSGWRLGAHDQRRRSLGRQ